MKDKYSREAWIEAVKSGAVLASYEVWVRKTREADQINQSNEKKTMTTATKTEAPRGRTVSPETKARIERLVAAGLAHQEIADILELNVESVERSLRTTLEKFTSAEVSVIALALGMLRGRKDRDFHDDREFDQLLLQSNSVSLEVVEALHKRVSNTGLLVD